MRDKLSKQLTGFKKESQHKTLIDFCVGNSGEVLVQGELICSIFMDLRQTFDTLTLFRMGFFGAAHGWEGAKKAPTP